ncbi:PREDICTED: uncharacterized protein LOC108363374 [Rhagoletis zephyria]|uniref:uncharacterized protein LOC108363374 n=1 Tax=Rhagoletis zephyria TaxID=28612 RepID=UPI000811804C|nr:PREDICTED: uncharacterized protein LOC108363374 [Rhagoletis zephyria]
MVYQHIKHKYKGISKDINKYQRTIDKHTNTKNSITFLIKCRQYNYTPNFIENSTKQMTSVLNNNDEILPPKFVSAKENFIERTKRIMMNLIIQEKHIMMKTYQRESHINQNNIKQYLTEEEMDQLLSNEEIRSKAYETKTKQLLREKFDKLKEKNNNNTNIIYNNNWFSNQTNIEIPEYAKLALSLGPKFALPFKQQDFPIFNIIADSEDCIQTIKEKEEQEIARTRVAIILDNEINKRPWDKTEKFITRTVGRTQKFLNQNKNILILDADKGNVTVAMDEEDYDKKMKNIVNDMMTYKRTLKDPTATLLKKSNDIIDKMATQNIINNSEKYKLKSTTARAPRIYGLPKVHKQDTPLRPICSNIDAPANKLCKFLANTLKKLTEKSVYNVKDSIVFRNKISDTNIRRRDNDILRCSLSVSKRTCGLRSQDHLT